MREAMRRGARASTFFARRRRGGVRLLPHRKRFPVVGSSHAAKDERCSGFEQGATPFFPLGFGADDFHAVGAERKNGECCRVDKIPVATIGRSLSGGVTGGIISNILPLYKGVNWHNLRKELKR